MAKDDITAMPDWLKKRKISEDVVKTLVKEGYTSMEALAMLTGEDISDINAGLTKTQEIPQGGGGPRVVVSTAAFHARVRGSVPGLGGLKETKLFLPHPRVKVSIVGSLRDREVACSASDRQG